MLLAFAGMLDQLDDDAPPGRIPDVRVFARTDPEQKLRIIARLEGERGLVAGSAFGPPGRGLRP